MAKIKFTFDAKKGFVEELVGENNISEVASSGVERSVYARKDYVDSLVFGSGSGSINLSGSNVFGSSVSNTHQFTGSVLLNNGITGSLLGTASNADKLNGLSDTAFAKLASSNAFTAANTFNNLATLAGGTIFSAGGVSFNSTLSRVLFNNSLVNFLRFDQTASSGYIHAIAEITSSTRMSAPAITGSLSGSSVLATSLSSSVLTVGHIDFNTSSAAPSFQTGRLYYDQDTGDLQYNTPVSPNSINIGQQTVLKVKNTTNATINKGKLVRISGGQGANPLISTASYENDNNSANTLGMVMNDIADNQFGYVLLEGVISGLNLDPGSPSLYTAGQILYLSSSGDYTNIAPIAPKHAVRLGEVIQAHQNQGVVFIRVQNGYELNELHDVLTSSISFGDLLMHSASVWTNSKTLSGSYQLTGSLAISGSFDLNVDKINLNGSTGSFGQILISQGSSNPIWKSYPTSLEVYVDPVNGSDITGTGEPLSPYQTINFAMTQVPLSIGDVVQWANEKLIFVLAPGVYTENVAIRQVRRCVSITGNGVKINGTLTVSHVRSDYPTSFVGIPSPWGVGSANVTFEVSGVGGGMEGGFTSLNIMVSGLVRVEFTSSSSTNWSTLIGPSFIMINNTQLLAGLIACYESATGPLGLTLETDSASIQGGCLGAHPFSGTTFSNATFTLGIKASNSQLKSTIGPRTNIIEIDCCRILNIDRTVDSSATTGIVTDGFITSQNLNVNSGIVDSTFAGAVYKLGRNSGTTATTYKIDSNSYTSLQSISGIDNGTGPVTYNLIDNALGTTYTPAIPSQWSASNTGTATSGAASSITDTSKSFTVNSLAGQWVHIIGGTGSGQARLIISNTATAITVTPNWSTNPTAGSQYRVTTITTVKAALDEVLSYSPANGTNWTDPDPTTVKEAIDRLAAAVAGLLGSSIP